MDNLQACPIQSASELLALAMTFNIAWRTQAEVHSPCGWKYSYLSKAYKKSERKEKHFYVQGLCHYISDCIIYTLVINHLRVMI